MNTPNYRENVTSSYAWLDDVELRKIIMMALTGGPADGLSADDLMAICGWADWAVFNYKCLEHVLAGNVYVGLDASGDVLFRISEKGKQEIGSIRPPHSGSFL